MNDNKKQIEENLKYIEEDIELIEYESEAPIEANNTNGASNYEINENIEILEEPITEQTNIKLDAHTQIQENQQVELLEISATEKINSSNNKNNNNKGNKYYIDYKLRLSAYIGIFIVLVILIVVLLQNTLNLTSSTKVNYNENSNLDYKVFLKPNEFYEEEYLGKDKVYVASLIEKVEIDFIYNFNIEKKSDIEFDYDVIGKLTINDSSSGKNYFEKEYVLLDKKTATIKDSTNYNLFEKIEIDYAYYNNLASNFKQQYGVETTSDLTVYLRVNKQNDINNIANSLDASAMFVKIPLSQKSIDIELNYKDINNSSYIIKTNESITDNIIFGIAAAITSIIAIVVAIRLSYLLGMLRTKKSNYDKYIDRILNKYDRLIVENKTGPDLIKNNVIKISDFEELIDVRDNIKLPIMYYVITKHVKCYFYIKHDRDLYLLTIKAVDLEENNIEKQ